MWWTLLGSILGKIPGVFGEYFNKKADIEKASLEYQRAVLDSQRLMAEAAAQAQLEYQTVALQATTPLFKQRLFWFLSVPIILSVALPDKAEVMWHNLSLIPDNYWALYSAVVCTIWGLPVAGNAIAKIFNGFTSYSSDKRADKIELQKVSSEQYKKALTDAWRLHNGPLSAAEVAKIDKTLDAMGEPPKKAL
jgi:hypothetical protein